MELWCPDRDDCRDDVHVTSVPSHLRKVLGGVRDPWPGICGGGTMGWRRSSYFFYDLISR